MRKWIAWLMAAVVMIMCFAGCAKPVSTEYDMVDVTVVKTYYKQGYIDLVYDGQGFMQACYPEIYRVTVKYKGVNYSINGRDTYLRYKDREGETVKAILEIKTYEDGTIKQDITELE